MPHSEDMKHNPHFEQYGAGSSPKLTEEIPSRPIYQQPRKRHPGMTPMESINIEGDALNRIAHGKVPQWIALSSWFVYGIPLAFLLGPHLMRQVEYLGNRLNALSSQPFAWTEWLALFMMCVITLFSVLIGAATLSILVRGTLNLLKKR